MNTGFPQEVLVREPAPPYPGEPPFALWHYTEDPDLDLFRPQVAATSPSSPPLVWAVDSRHAPVFWFPRDCPRGCIWAVSTTTPDDRERFFGQCDAGRIHVIESGWLDRVRKVRLYAYGLPTESSRPGQVGGYWVTDEAVQAQERTTVDDVLTLHADALIELRTTPSLWPFWKRVAASTVEFSGIRLRNSDFHPDRFD